MELFTDQLIPKQYDYCPNSLAKPLPEHIKDRHKTFRKNRVERRKLARINRR